MSEAAMDLTGKLLVAMPGMGDSRFEHSVVLICAHSPEGAMGLIVNKPLPEPGLDDLFAQLGIAVTVSDKPEKRPILFGGPVETGRGFVLHSPDWQGEHEAMDVTPELSMTATRDILVDIAAGMGPERSLLALGYSGWGPGQLEDEILANGWLIAESDAEIALGREYASKWTRALNAMGIDPRTLSSAAGHA